jgi:hypothetical protein
MVRYVLASAAAIVMASGVAVAEPAGPSMTTVRQSEHGTHITKHFVNHRGEMVTKRKLIGNDGTMVARSRTVTDPSTGVKTTTRTHTDY